MNTEGFIKDVVYRLQVCFPDYRISGEAWEQANGTFVAVHLSKDRRDEWRELVPDRDGNMREVRMQGFHIQSPIPSAMLRDPEGLQRFRVHLTQQFVSEWFMERLRRAGVEP